MSAPRIQTPATPEEIRDRICDFLSRCAESAFLKPILKEDDGEAIAVEDGHYSVEARQGKVLLEVWDESRSLMRRVVGIRRESPSELALIARRLGAGESVLRIYTSSKTDSVLRSDQWRRVFAGRLRKMLAQHYPGWKVEHVSSDKDLSRSFSCHVTRTTLSRGQEVWAVAGCAEQEGEEAADSALTQAIAWMHHLREAERARRHGPPVRGLKVFLPERFAAATALRLPYLNRALARYELFVFTNHDEVQPAGEPDFPNLATDIPPATFSARVEGRAIEWLQRLASMPGVGLTPKPSLGLACSIRGLAFARATEHAAWFGTGEHWQTLDEDSLAEAEDLAARIARFRQPDSPDRRHPFYTTQPERWLESIILANVGALSGELDPRFCYSQVPAVLGRERGIMDLLAVTRAGRLVVLELKAAKDLDLPLQALDYWMRVKLHLDRGEFSRLGYFPGVLLRPDPPLLWLVIPAYDFHPVNEAVLRYLSPGIPVRCLGINQDWRHSLQVVTRT